MKRFKITNKNILSIGKSALISLGAIGFVLVLKTAFPMDDFSILQTSVTTSISAFVIASMYKFVSNE